MKYSDIKLDTEEDIKIKAIIPYLQSMGFNFEELEFETGLSLRLGTHKFMINGAERKEARGRIDILCIKDKKNLFVLEVKIDDKEIVNDDIEQAISYARLIHPISPYAIISNGKHTLIYNVIAKTEIKNKSLINQNGNFEISIEEELKMRYEALQNFIGYSANNVIEFTKSQISQRMLALKGGNGDFTKKYVPELFVNRFHLIQEFESFSKSDSRCFALIGESGVGKTNSLCDLTLRMSKTSICLFFNGTFLNESIITSIKSDFSWVFSQNLETVDILRKLDGLMDKNQYQMFLFIDAIDEIKYPNFALELNDLIQKLAIFPKIKICFSCKSYEWERFTEIDGQSTIIKDTLFCNRPYELSKFDNNEFKIAEEKYRKVFKYKGIINEKLKEETNLGIMLRVLAEVYENQELPEEFNEFELFKGYFEKKVEKIKKERTYNILSEIGKIIIDNDVEFHWNGFTGIVDEELLRHKLAIPVHMELFPELFAHNILIRYQEENGKNQIGFYFNRFKNFVIAAISFKLNSIKGDLFKRTCEQLIKGHNGQEALLWYLRNANYEHVTLFKEIYFRRAEEFVKSYNDLLDNKFTQIKSKFEPFTNDKIGISLPFNLEFDFIEFAFVQIENKKQYVELINKGSFKLFHINTRADRYNFMTLNPKKAAIYDITLQLKRIIENARLDEMSNLGLAMEKIQAILFNYSKEVGMSQIDLPIQISYIKPLLPINIKEIINRIELKSAEHYVKNMLIESGIKAGKIPITQFGDYITYSISEDFFDKDLIIEEVKKLIESNAEIPVINISGNSAPYLELYNSLKIVSSKVDVINELYLPIPDLTVEEIYKKSNRASYSFILLPKETLLFSDEEFLLYVKKFFECFLQEYISIVENNFSQLCNFFKIYSTLPVCFHIEIYKNNHYDYLISYGYNRAASSENLVEVILNPEESKFKLNSDFDSWTSSGVGFMFNPYRPINIQSNVDTEKSNRMCPVRSFLYEVLNNEINRVIDKLKKV